MSNIIQLGNNRSDPELVGELLDIANKYHSIDFVCRATDLIQKVTSYFIISNQVNQEEFPYLIKETNYITSKHKEKVTFFEGTREDITAIFPIRNLQIIYQK